MIQRRQFLCAASAAALSLTAPSIFASKPGNSAPLAAALGWDSTEIQTVRHGGGHRKPVATGVSLQSEGSLLAIVGDDHFVSLYDIAAEQFVDHLKRHTDWVRAARFSPDSVSLYTCGNDRKLIRWETDDLTIPTFTVRRPEAIINLAVFNDATRVATVGFNEDLIIHSAEDGKEIAKLKCACNDNHAVAVSADDSLIAAGGRCGTIRVWSTSTLKMVREFKPHRRRIRSLEFDTAGRLISASDDQTIQIRDLEIKERSISLPRHASKLFATKVITPSVIATGGSDNKIHIWNTERQSEVGFLEGHTGTVSSIDMAQDILVSASFDTTVRIWKPTADELAAVIPNRPSANGTRNASGGFDIKRR